MKLKIIYAVYLLIILLFNNTFSQVISDSLQGSTIGTQYGGSFTSEGYSPGIGNNNYITYTVSNAPYNGYVEVEVKGFNMNDFPPVSSENLLDNNAFIYMYDGRGLSDPLNWSPDYRNNLFRWEIVYLGPKYNSNSGDRFKSKMLIASPTTSGNLAQGEPAVFPYISGTTDLDIDWKNEPSGIPANWNPNIWYTIRISWDNDNKDYKVFRNETEVWNIKKNMGEPYPGEEGYPSTSPYPRVPVDFKINLGSGPRELANYMPNLVYRNFKVVSTGVIENSAPVITSTALTSGFVGNLYNYDVNTDGYPFPTYSLSTSPSGMTINSNTGLIEWTPDSIGDYNVVVVATNGVSPDATQSFTINVQIPTETAPVFTSTPITNGIVGEQYIYDVNTDGNPAVTYTLTSAPSGMTINSINGIIRWTPTNDGNFNVIVKATNGVSPDATQSFTINVQTIAAPTITTSPITNGIVGQQYIYDVDTDGNPAITYSLTTAPDGMTIRSNTGLIEWLPTAAGNYNVTINATNGINPDATQSFIISVEDTTLSYINISPETIQVGHAAGQTTLVVESDVNWSVSVDVEWLTISPQDSSGNSNLVISFQQNNTSSNRVGTITVRNDSLTANASIVQSKASYYLNVSPSSWSVAKNSGLVTFSIESNHEWQIYTNDHWLSTTISDSAGNALLPISFKTNTDTSKRIGLVYIESEYFLDSVTVVQNEAKPIDIIVSINPPEAGTITGTGIYGEGSSITLAAKSNNGWKFDNWTENSSIVGSDSNLTFKGSADRLLIANFSVLTDIDIINRIPEVFNLGQNYPNPFNPTTTINFSLPEESSVTLSIYNLLGQKLFDINNDNYSAGYHTFNFDASRLTSGIYIYSIQAIGIKGNNFISTKKMILMK